MSACQRVPCRGPAAGVEAQPGDDHVGVAALGVDRHPLALAGLAPAHEAGGVERLVEQAGAVEGVGQRARAVIARVRPTCRARRRTCRAWWRSRCPPRRSPGPEAVRRPARSRARRPRPRPWARPGPTLHRLGRDARLDRHAQGAGVGEADAAVDAALGAALPRAHLHGGPAAVLAVHGRAKSGAGQEVLQHPDVAATHPHLERPLPEGPLGSGVCVGDWKSGH